MQERDEAIPLPPNPAEYLTRWLFEIGPAVPAGMGQAPLGWRDIAAWQEIVGVKLLVWEARLLRRLSRDFVNASHDARKADCPAPWSGIETHDDVTARRADVSRKLTAMFAGLKQG